jgi:hypothetical protein
MGYSKYIQHRNTTTISKVLRLIANAPRYVPNTVLYAQLLIPTVKAEITNFGTKYREKLTVHPDELIPALVMYGYR